MKWMALASACIALGAGFSGEVWARAELVPNDQQLKSMPPFCAAKFNRPGSNPAQWEATLGPGNFIHIHHYCFGINLMRQYWLERDANERRGILKAAMGTYEYVVAHTLPDFYLRPQIYVELGQVYRLQRQTGEAVRIYGQALEKNPEMVNAYLGLIEVHRETGNHKEALEVATDGLRHVPASKALQEAYLGLGGKKPFPEPVVAKAERVEEPNQEAGRGAPGVGEESVAPGGATEGAPESPAASGEAPGATPPPPASNRVERGCRFCTPDELNQRWQGSFKGSEEAAPK